MSFKVGGAATYLSDYTVTGATTFGPTSGTITFGFAQATVLVYLRPVDDDLVESNEIVSLTVASGSGYVVGSPSSAMATIIESPPSLLAEMIDAAFVDGWVP